MKRIFKIFVRSWAIGSDGHINGYPPPPIYFFNVILRLVLDDGTRGYPSSPLLFLLSFFPPVIKTLFVQSVRTK